MEFMQVIRKRKSIRSYHNDQITNEELAQILYAGSKAPISYKDYKSIKISVIQEPELLHKINSIITSVSDPLYGVPTLIIISTTKACIENIEYFNVACIVENMLLSATNLDLGSIFLTFFLQDLVKYHELLMELGIPDGFRPIAAVGVGYTLASNNDTDKMNMKNFDQSTLSYTESNNVFNITYH